MQTHSSTPTGMCSRERSEMSSDYARNFICDFILGREQPNKQLALDFDL